MTVKSSNSASVGVSLAEVVAANTPTVPLGIGLFSSVAVASFLPLTDRASCAAPSLAVAHVAWILLRRSC